MKVNDKYALRLLCLGCQDSGVTVSEAVKNGFRDKTVGTVTVGFFKARKALKKANLVKIVTVHVTPKKQGGHRKQNKVVTTAKGRSVLQAQMKQCAKEANEIAKALQH